MFIQIQPKPPSFPYVDHSAFVVEYMETIHAIARSGDSAALNTWSALFIQKNILTLNLIKPVSTFISKCCCCSLCWAQGYIQV